MSKRQEIRARRQRARVRSRVVMILLVVGGALLVLSALILPSLNRGDATEAAVTPAAPRDLGSRIDGTSLGDPNAPVRVDVWEDFQCPSCKIFSEGTEQQLIDQYVTSGQVYYTYHFFAFIDGRVAGGESQQSANAAMCALEQGKFWEYHDTLFANWDGENQGGFADARLIAFAEHLALDMEAFTACFEENRYKNEIDQDYLAGQAAGVQGTPSVFVNGTLVTPGYVPSFADLSQAIETALAGGQ
jgi:protein-disulfide isomerase